MLIKYNTFKLALFLGLILMAKEILSHLYLGLSC